MKGDGSCYGDPLLLSARKLVGIVVSPVLHINLQKHLICTILGEGAAYAFEQIYLGKKSLDDVDWVKKMMESKLADEFAGKAENVIKNLPEKPNFKNVSQLIVDTFSKKT